MIYHTKLKPFTCKKILTGSPLLVKRFAKAGQDRPRVWGLMQSHVEDHDFGLGSGPVGGTPTAPPAGEPPSSKGALVTADGTLLAQATHPLTGRDGRCARRSSTASTPWATVEIDELAGELGAEAILQRCGMRLMAGSYLVHRLTGRYVLIPGCTVGALPGSYSVAAGMATSGAITDWLRVSCGD